jgi:hypothetical protein
LSGESAQVYFRRKFITSGLLVLKSGTSTGTNSLNRSAVKEASLEGAED